MDKQLLTKFYAQRFYPFLKKESGKDITQTLTELMQIIQGSGNLEGFLSHPSFTIYEKVKLIFKSFGKNIDEETRRILYVLIKNNHVMFLRQIIEEIEKISQVKKGIENVEVKSALRLSEEQKTILQKKISVILDKEILPTFIVEEELIAGFVIKIKGHIIDTSIRSSIEKLRDKFAICC